MQPWIDGSLYPDQEIPDSLDTLADRVDFLARMCLAWDFGILPEDRTIQEVKKKRWRPAVDSCRLLTSPTYHLLRRWHGLSRLPFLGQPIPLVRDDPSLDFV